MLFQILAVQGEQSGQMGVTLESVATFLDEQNETVVKTLSSIIEPCVLILIGVVVGIVALSMYLPLFDLTAMTH